MDKKTLRKTRDNIRTTLALYSNIALTTVEKLCEYETDNSKDFISYLKGWDQNRKVTVAKKLYTNFYFIERLFSKEEFKSDKNQVEKRTEQAAIDNEQADHVIAWLKLLYNFRCYFTHSYHPEPTVNSLEKKVKDLLLELYEESLLNSKAKMIPFKYHSSNGLFYIYTPKPEPDKDKKTYRQKPKHNKIEGQTYFTLTAEAFIISLFLDKGQVNEFIEALEIDHLPFGSEKDRAEFKQQSAPGEQYPAELRPEKKLFLYARDIYTFWAVRGHTTHFALSTDSVDKEKYFAILEYLKRMPQERKVIEDYTESERVADEKDSKKHYTIDLPIRGEAYNFDSREKNRFMEWGLEFFETEYKKHYTASKNGFSWAWARHASAEDKSKKNLILEKIRRGSGPVSERIQKLPRHEKVIWEIPENIEERLNSRNEENGYPYYFEKDESGANAQALFCCTRGNKKVVGLMGHQTLCCILEAYFTLFPLDKEHTDKINQNKFFEEVIKSCFNQIETLTAQKANETKEKHVITKAEVEARVAFLKEKYENLQEETNLHKRIIAIADTWNQMVSYGERKNPVHALDENGVIGGKNGYQQIIKCLSLMSPAPLTLLSDNEEDEEAKKKQLKRLEYERNRRADDLIKLLKSLGGNKTLHTYYDKINRMLNINNKKAGNTKKIEEYKTVEELFKLCIEDYRLGTLKQYEEKLTTEPFDSDFWEPGAAMRWLNLKDSRTCDFAQSEANEPKELKTGIINVDQHYHSAVGLPQNLRALFANNPLEKALENYTLPLHKALYPSPNRNTLLIPSFYESENHKLWEDLKSWEQKKLYQIRREDTLLSHIAYYYLLKTGEKKTTGLQLLDIDFQRLSLKVPVTDSENGNEILANIEFYYRHYKQNRYRLPVKITTGIIKVLIENEVVFENKTIKRGDVIPYNNFQLKKKSELSNKDKIAFYIGNEDKKLPEEEQLKIANEYLEQIKADSVFIPTQNTDTCLLKLLMSYTLCRKVFISKVLELEGLIINRYRELQNNRSPQEYIAFTDICDKLREKNLLDDNEVNTLRQLRNAAFHSSVPQGDLLLKNGLVKRIRNNPKEEYLDLFGLGLEIIYKLKDKLEEGKKKK